MAKNTNKGAAKKGVDLSGAEPASIKNNKLVIDLNSNPLSDVEIQKILKAAQKMTAARAIEPANKTQRANNNQPPLKAAPVTATSTDAVLTATFFNTIPGKSELTATHKGISKRITQSGTITFDNVSVNDLIRINGISLGKSIISINRTSNPQQREFPAGDFGFHFTVKQ